MGQPAPDRQSGFASLLKIPEMSFWVGVGRFHMGPGFERVRACCQISKASEKSPFPCFLCHMQRPPRETGTLAIMATTHLPHAHRRGWPRSGPECAEPKLQNSRPWKGSAQQKNLWDPKLPFDDLALPTSSQGDFLCF